MRANLAVTHDRTVPIGIELVRPAGLVPTAPYAYAAVPVPGRMVFPAGACPLDAAGAVVGVGDVAGQARQAMANPGTALEGAGVGLGEHDARSTLVGVTVLGYPGQLVEVEAVAVVDSWPEPAPPNDGSHGPGDGG